MCGSKKFGTTDNFNYLYPTFDDDDDDNDELAEILKICIACLN